MFTAYTVCVNYRHVDVSILGTYNVLKVTVVPHQHDISMITLVQVLHYQSDLCASFVPACMRANAHTADRILASGNAKVPN